MWPTPCSIVVVFVSLVSSIVLVCVTTTLYIAIWCIITFTMRLNILAHDVIDTGLYVLFYCSWFGNDVNVLIVCLLLLLSYPNYDNK